LVSCCCCGGDHVAGKEASMSVGSLMHDCAVAGATALLDMVAPALRPEERRECFDEAYHICLAMLEAYGLEVRRETAKRLRPSCN
jgi:hypothetical protein